MAVELASKLCPKCGEVKPLSEFYRSRSALDGAQSSCKSCSLAQVKAATARRRAEMGDEAFLREQRRVVDRHRRRTNNRTGRAYSQARIKATKALIDAHRAEFDHLLLLARRGELNSPK